ncbi:glycoside hydrolase family 55 protein [Glonium stellatum]|uniref:Glycoside hydrolase family 55 protein n=1 Tax=Glonium stellatum TaxID=574774 RepID=A0A8E2ET91_9PEZI|nr:glycoside hydrolase family 55 protein [Glonium stellatum]
MALGTAFPDLNNPKPIFRVGNPGDVGSVEMSDLIFETLGPAPGAIIACMWDVHWRIGGTAGTQLQSDKCTKTPAIATVVNPACVGAFLLMHITSEASIYMENNWGWVADHELDLSDHNQINIYNGRGILIESRIAVWIYFQGNPNALDPFPPDPRYFDPTFENCFQAICYKTLGLRIYNSTYVLNYGAGLYSFFNNYDQCCLLTEACQQDMVEIELSEGIYLYGLSTLASQSMVTVDYTALVPSLANLDTFCQTVAIFEYA